MAGAAADLEHRGGAGLMTLAEAHQISSARARNQKCAVLQLGELGEELGVVAPYGTSASIAPAWVRGAGRTRAAVTGSGHDVWDDARADPESVPHPLGGRTLLSLGRHPAAAWSIGCWRVLGDLRVVVYEVILVVDGSPDDTWAVARSLSHEHAEVEAIRLSRNFGQQNALLAGIRQARHDVVVTIDDDLQHRPEDLPPCCAALTDEVDLVYGVPARQGHGLARGVATRVGRTVLARGLGVEHARHVTAYRVFRTRLREGFAAVDGPHVSIDVSLAWTTTYVRGVPVARDPRAEGRSGYTAASLLRQFLLWSWATACCRCGSSPTSGCSLALGGAGLLAYVVLAYVAGYTQVPGFTFLASMIALFSGAQMLAIGVLGEYLGRLHLRSTGRPSYVITRDEG